jgi:hypothetical protein
LMIMLGKPAQGHILVAQELRRAHLAPRRTLCWSYSPWR